MTDKIIIRIKSYCTQKMAETLPIAPIARYCKKIRAEDARRNPPIARLSNLGGSKNRRNPPIALLHPLKGALPRAIGIAPGITLPLSAGNHHE